jgi:hypothetical protein
MSVRTGIAVCRPMSMSAPGQIYDVSVMYASLGDHVINEFFDGVAA